jgi:hypothetical protein
MSEGLQGILCGWLEDDREGEVAEAADVTSGGPLGVALAEVVFAAFEIRGVCGEHVIDADDELMSDRQSGAAAAAAPPDSAISARKIARPLTPKMSLTTPASLMSAISSNLIKRRRSDPWLSTRVRR